MPLPPHVYRHDAAGFLGYRVCFRGHPTVQRYFSERTLGKRRARRDAIAFAAQIQREREQNPGTQRLVHRTKVRGHSGVRGVLCSRNTWYATWYDPPLTVNRVYTGTGDTAFRKACRIRRAAESLIALGRPTRSLLK